MSPKIKNIGFWGLVTGSKIYESWNLEFGAFEIIKSNFDGTNLKQINSRKLLKVLFEHMFTIDGPNIAIIIPINCHKIFLWFSYDFPMIFLCSLSIEALQHH